MKLYKEDGETYPNVKVLNDDDQSPLNFTEITDIAEAHKLGLSVVSEITKGWSDKLLFRSKLKSMIYTKMQINIPDDVSNQVNWDRLNFDEKKIAADLFVIGRESFFLEVENDLRNWTLKAGEFRKWSQDARSRRTEIAESIVFMRMLNLGDAKLTLADMNQIAKDTVIDIDDVSKKVRGKVRVKKLNKMYIEGLEDEEHDGVVAILDWLKSTPGTPYQNNGFMNLSYPFKGAHTSETVRDEILSVLDGTF
jgi:hypothetical protein